MRLTEAARLNALESYQVLDTAPEQAFDDITQLAAQHFGVPIALVSLVDDHRQWFKARVGLDAQETPREIAFCSLAIESRQVMVVEDATLDGRFANNPLVTQAPDIRFYAGAPLITPEGHALGTLCVIDRRPRSMSDADKALLQVMSQQVVMQLELRKTNTELNAALTALKAEQIRLTDLARQVPGVVYQYQLRPDGSSCFPFASPGIEAIYEVTPEQVAQDARLVFERLHPDDLERVSASIDESARTLSHWQCEYRVNLPQQGICWRQGTANPQQLPDGSIVWHGFITDISERKQMDVQLQERTLQAESANVAKSGFLANMSHEIRTPMNAILGMLNLLGSTQLDSHQQDYADKAKSAATSLLGLLNDILDFSKIEADKLDLNPHPFSLHDLLRDLAVVLSNSTGLDKRSEVLFDVAQGIPPVLLADALRLKQVLLNLAGNAVKFTPKGQLVVGIRELGRSAASTRLEFFIQDSGIGIAPEHQALVFESFTQAEASTTRQFGGTGLGLAISKRLVEMMGGSLQLHSELGVGSTFSFVLELPVPADIPVDLQHQVRARWPDASISPRRVLVVDDNPIAARLNERMVSAWGWPVSVAQSGMQALEIIQQGIGPEGFPFDVVYLDWSMPGMDGWTTARRIREISQACAGQAPDIVMVTAKDRSNLEQRTHAEQDMLSAYLVKPVTASMLQEAALGKGTAHRIRKGDRQVSSLRRLEAMRLLVVEDNLINQQVAEQLLLKEGAEVVLAANGKLGVEAVAAAKKPFDAVLMDLHMPVMDGYEATREIREGLGLRDLPIVAITANAMASDRATCLAAGMNEHVGKPFELGHLVDVLLRLTTRSKAPAPSTVQATTHTAAPDAPYIDTTGALARLGGLKPLYRRALAEFAQGLTTLPEQYRDAVASNMAQASELMHTTKGTAATLGAIQLSLQSAELEKLCRGNPALNATSEGAAALAQCVALTQKSLQVVLAWLDGNKDPSPPPHPPTAVSNVRAVLEELIPLLAASDLRAPKVFAAHPGAWAALPQQDVAELERALQDLDMASAYRQCDQLLANLSAGATHAG